MVVVLLSRISFFLPFLLCNVLVAGRRLVSDCSAYDGGHNDKLNGSCKQQRVLRQIYVTTASVSRYSLLL